MSNRNNDVLNNGIQIQTIERTDTITRFMEKCNNNFSKLLEHGGGTEGAQGEQGAQGLPTKPKVPIHVWRKGIEYDDEPSTADGGFEMTNIHEDLENEKYQSGHLILLQNGHVYILEPMAIDGFDLEPKFILALQSYDPQAIIDGKSAYMHIAYADNVYGDNMVTDQQLRNENTETEPIATFGLRRSSVTTASSDVSDKPYMGIYSDFEETSSTQPHRYTWVRIQGQVGPVGEIGPQGEQGPQGPKGDEGDAFTGQQYTIDLEGDMSTISLDVDRTRLYDESGDYCKCTLHAYYGSENVELNTNDVTIGLPDEFIEINSVIVLKTDHSKKVGKIVKEDYGKNVIIKFTPDNTFVFPQKYITFPISVSTTINDTTDKKTYNFYRETKWSIKGIVSPFKLEIIPQYRVIKLDKNGYIPNTLNVFVYKVEDGKREIFDFSKYTDFKFQYKNINTDTWNTYPSDGVSTNGVSCLEFRVVRYIDSEGSNSEGYAEIWDYEDVWVVADGKDTHYYHGDLGNTESMMVLTTGRRIEVTEKGTTVYCAELRNKDGYSISFNPKFYDGSNEITKNTSVSVSCENKFGESFEYNFDPNTYTLTIKRVPYGIEIIPMTFSISAEDDDGVTKFDTIYFNVYISTSSDLYTLQPSVSAYNTSTGKNNEKIECKVFKNTNLIESTVDELNKFALELKCIIYSESGNKNYKSYTAPLKYGTDFIASDVAIDFILSYQGDEIVRSTVPLIKDGIDGKDGDAWQYIFCRSSKYPFNETGISDPSGWKNAKDNSDIPDFKDSSKEYFGEYEDNYITEKDKFVWYDDHKGVDSTDKYEYQSYRKWDKINKCWDVYTSPTLYSNYSESGSGYSVMLSNPVAIIPVGDDDWIANEDNANQSDSTLVYLYNNTSDMSKFDSVTISIPDNYKSHFSTGKDENNINKVTFNPNPIDGSPFDFGSNAQYKLPITVTYKSGDNNFDDFVSTINWTLTPIKGLEDVEVFVDKRVVNTSTAQNHTFRVGYYLTSSNSDRTFIDDRINGNTKGYDIILTDDIDKLTIEKIVENWTNAKFDFEYNNGSNKNCYVVLVKKLENENGITFNIIDYINIESVNNGIDGKSEIHLELSQDYISLPCNIYGKVHESYTENVSFKMTLYNGDTPIENNSITYDFKIGNEYITSVVGINENIFTIPQDKINGNTNIECIATYKSIPYTKTLYIELSETPYELEFNKNTLTRDLNIGVNGEIIDEFLIISVKYWDSTKGMWIYTNDGKLKITVPNDTITINDTDFNKLNDSKCKRQLAIPDALRKNTNDTELRVSYYINNEDEISYELIGIINRAKNGADGKSSIHLELSQDYIALPCDNNGNIHFSYGDNTPISSRMILYNGDTPIESEYISHYIKPKNGSVTTPVGTTDGTFVIPRDMIDGDTYIECIATYNGVSYQKTLFIDLEETPYELELNKNVFVRDPNNKGWISNEDLTVSVKYWDSQSGKWVYTNEGDVKIKYINEYPGESESMVHSFYSSNGNPNDFVRRLNDTDKGIIRASRATEFRISYSIGEKEVSYEIIGVVYDGEKGTPPSCQNVEIIGYSLEKLDVDSNEWANSLKELGTIAPGEPIYMLNKFTWSDGNITKSITTTLSGTQGVDGKSRVLFYLGSFKDGTLKGDEVMGHLTDERCDYYIDIKGNAWMRTGSDDSTPGFEEGVPGLKNGADSSPYWKSASKVGFLQAGAIHANMINVGSISAATGFLDELRALDVNASTIKGHTIQSNENFKYNGVDTPTWQINNDGDGWLANKNIEWKANGDLTINGKINGSIGNENDNVIINGNLMVGEIMDEKIKPSLFICGNHLYPNIKINTNIDDNNKISHSFTTEDSDRSIILSSGFYDILYCWEICDEKNDEEIYYIPEYIYIKYLPYWVNGNIIGASTTINEIYLYNNNANSYFLFTNFNSAIIKNEWILDGMTFRIATYMYLYINNNKYKYIYNKEKNKNLNEKQQIETADTIIFSNGEIQTNSILVRYGEFNGTIHSDGDFSGELKNATGSINEALIYNSNIELYNEHTLLANYQYEYTDDAGKTNLKTKKIFELNPNLSIVDNASTIKFSGISWSKREKNKIIHDVKIANKIIGKLWVPAKTANNSVSATIDKITFTVSSYQPRNGDGTQTDPTVILYWRYVGNKNYIEQSYKWSTNIGDSDKELYNIKYLSYSHFPTVHHNDLTLVNNDGRSCKWEVTAENLNISAENEGEIEIIAHFRAYLTPKQLWDYPSVTFTISDFNITTESPHRTETNCIMFGNNGMAITAEDGGQISSVHNNNIDISDSGSIKLMSPNKNHGIIITDKGIILYDGTRTNGKYAKLTGSSWTNKSGILSLQ